MCEIFFFLSLLSLVGKCIPHSRGLRGPSDCADALIFNELYAIGAARSL